MEQITIYPVFLTGSTVGYASATDSQTLAEIEQEQKKFGKRARVVAVIVETSEGGE